MRVYFKNSKGNEILIGEADDDGSAMRIIKRFCRERSFEIPYMRCWQKENRTFVDVGSHVELFVVEH